MIALGAALHRRGHDVTLQTWERWRAHVVTEGLQFAPAPEYHVFPQGPEPLDFYEAVVHATRDTAPLVAEMRPDIVVSDILTLAPALAAELHSVPVATLIPHVYPEAADGFPIYSFGARLPRTAAGRAFWRRAHWPVQRGLESGRAALNRVRGELGLPALSHFHGGTSRELAIVGTFPQLEYPRPWPPHVKVVGPLMWEPPGEQVMPPTEPPRAGSSPGTAGRGAFGAAAQERDRATHAATHWGPARDGGQTPVVLVAPSTSQDPEHRLLIAALKGLADAPVRVIATWNRRLPPRGLPVPANATLVEWVSYSKTMPHCDLVVCHAGHGTLARALASGCPVVACPVAGDMNENAARIAWSGAGVRLPRRFIAPRPLHHAVQRALQDQTMRARAQQIARWSAANDPADMAARLVERLIESPAVRPKQTATIL
jgi:UDP:flavonoid glycosyltransferase YjiC (YdhE family)